MLWSAVTPRSIQSQDLNCGRRFITEDLVLDLRPCEAPFASGASVGAVCPPAFTVPTALSVVSGRLSQPRTTFWIWTSAPSTESLTCLTSFFHRPPWDLISVLESADLSACSPITNHWSAALALPTVPSRTTTKRQRKTLPDYGSLSSYYFTPFPHDSKACQSGRYRTLVLFLTNRQRGPRR